jgi:hypothetical protein
MRAALLLLPLALCAACLRQTEFNCSLNSQCNPGGMCQTSVGYCSFSDSACSSGQRFGDSAGPLAGQCVGGQTGGDGGGIDAPVIDGPAVGCPSTYEPLPGGPAGHVYLKAPQTVTGELQDNFCRSTSARAYLAVPDDITELTNLHTLAAGATFWVGVHDRTMENRFDKLSGGLATFLPWTAGQPDNAGGGQGEDCVASTATNFSDEECKVNGGGTGADRPAVCECEP